jgi:protein-S-isoprenylcysteine O-methyltransferase Ste14
MILFGTLATPAFVGVVVFGSAGRWDLPMVWAYLATLAVIGAACMIGIDPGLLKERRKPGPGGRDYIVIHAGKILLLIHLVIAGLDIGRYHWSDRVPMWMQILGLVVFAAGMGSWLSLVPTALFDLLILRRTVIEDRFLRAELDGYEAYSGRVRYRLVPGIW